MRLVRTGESMVGVHFVARHAPYLARGWIRSLELVDGPLAFSVFFDGNCVASTTDGRITVDSFTPEAVADMRAKANAAYIPLPDDPTYFNMTCQARVHLVADEPPPRQNYYVRQTWAQLFETKQDDETKSPTEAELREVPCMLAFNLRAADRSSTVLATRPVQRV